VVNTQFQYRDYLYGGYLVKREISKSVSKKPPPS
jgi:hypothetical protein